MNLLTFDIEDWYNCDFITPDMNWERYEVRIYEGVDRILKELEGRRISGTFFCLGWIAEKHPEVIRKIHKNGHHIGCHSYRHELAFRLDRNSFKEDTSKAKSLIEDLIGEKVNAYRAPGFSITEKNTWALEVLVELGFEYDCSIFPAAHDYGGFVSYGKAEPAVIQLNNNLQIKEFPMNTRHILGRNLVFSGGGFFRFYPYFLIKDWAIDSSYLMTYFHPRDFDPGQPMLESLPPMRKFKSYVGLSTAFAKFQNLLNDFTFVSVKDAGKLVNWETSRIVQL
jgi:polysaccharide deacetylase family protein (PEP-CTERM system associated)